MFQSVDKNSTIYQDLYDLSCKRARHTIWVLSDLQQAKYENAEKCLNICMDDYYKLGCPADMMWYLGDSTEQSDLNELERMTKLQIDEFDKLNIPLCYATGNHDYDYPEYCHYNGIKEFKMPFYDAVRDHDGWYTTADYDQTWFKVPVGDYMVYFLCDHVAKDLSWCRTHNRLRFGENYPYGPEHYAMIRKDMEECEKDHIITASHYAFPGGNRDTYHMGLIQPLPLKVHLHLYGHSHIGEYACPKERIFSKIQWIDWQDIPQVDIASFENIRGSFYRSAVLHIYEDNTLGLFFRNHDEHKFESAFFPAASSAELEGRFSEEAGR